MSESQERFLNPLCGRKLGASRGFPIMPMSEDEEALYEVFEVMKE